MNHHMMLQAHSLLEGVPAKTISEHAFSRIAQHRLHMCGKSQHSRGYLRHVSLGEVSLSNLGFGSEAIIEATAPQHYYYVHVVLNGSLVVDSHGKQTTIDKKSIAAINPFHKVDLHHSEDCCKLVVRIGSEIMERTLAGILGYTPHEPIEFGISSTSLDEPRIGSLTRAIEHVCVELIDPFSIYRTAYLARQSEGLLAASVLTCLPHCYSDEIKLRIENGGPSYLRRAEQFIEAHLSENISINDLARSSGASLRSLYTAFNTFRKATPMGYVKRVRLEHAKRELENPCSSLKTVADVAMEVGMGHLGNFAADYKLSFGELPSETIRRRNYWTSSLPRDGVSHLQS